MSTIFRGQAPECPFKTEREGGAGKEGREGKGKRGEEIKERACPLLKPYLSAPAAPQLLCLRHFDFDLPLLVFTLNSTLLVCVAILFMINLYSLPIFGLSKIFAIGGKAGFSHRSRTF